MFEEKLRVGLACAQAGASGIVAPASLDGVVGDVEFVVGHHVLAEHERDALGELRRMSAVT